MKVLITHIDLDGYAANVIAQTWNVRFDKIYNVNYGFENNLELTSEFLKEDSELTLVDISVPEAVFLAWSKKVKSIEVFDHHFSASYLDSYSNGHYAQNMCGSKLWLTSLLDDVEFDEYPLVGKLCEFVELVNTYDLWQTKNTLWQKAVELNHLFSSFEDKLEFVKHIVAQDLRPNWSWSPLESTIIERQNAILDNFLLYALNGMIVRNDSRGEAYGIVAVDNSNYISLVCHEILKQYSDIKYIISYNSERLKKNPNYATLSFRSQDDFDLTQLEGVKGHKNAAGRSFNLQADKEYFAQIVRGDIPVIYKADFLINSKEDFV